MASKDNNSNNIKDNSSDDNSRLCDSIYQRRSIRKYKKDEISGKVLEKILDAARVAPSGKNRQPWKFLVYGGDEKKEILAMMRKGIKRELKEPLFKDSKRLLPDADNTLRIMMTAPIVIFVLNTNGVSPMETIDMDGRFTEICDSLSIGAAIENMLLRAQQLGVGSLWIGNTCFAYEELMDYIDEAGQLIGAVALGYADEKPEARPRKKLEDIVEYHI
ncbi:nitroreductase family protein [Eubacterium sp. MSJ-13]|uniref:nitroreductase family protein n=1 Tax=Eubacterium sp. MSJ-13 TaxID=2841513 RepID=UPI001C10EEC6|nr:nitroreductase family protein [Eubacterium sp. MSJ-13]MBU5478083.1 nitroreductase family protein [Eubacterium sp. MSJ-13]